MKQLSYTPMTCIIITASFILAGCGNDLSIPKANAEMPNHNTSQTASTALSTSNTSQLQSRTQHLADNSASNASGSVAETPPEKTSLWVTLAGMKCH